MGAKKYNDLWGWGNSVLGACMDVAHRVPGVPEGGMILQQRPRRVSCWVACQLLHPFFDCSLVAVCGAGLRRQGT